MVTENEYRACPLAAVINFLTLMVDLTLPRVDNLLNSHLLSCVESRMKNVKNRTKEKRKRVEKSNGQEE